MCVFGLSDYLHEALLSGGLLAVFFKNKMCVFCLSDYFYEALLSHWLLAAIIRCAQVCLYCVNIYLFVGLYILYINYMCVCVHNTYNDMCVCIICECIYIPYNYMCVCALRMSLYVCLYRYVYTCVCMCVRA